MQPPKVKRTHQCDLCTNLDEEDMILVVQGAGKILVDVDFSTEEGSSLLSKLRGGFTSRNTQTQQLQEVYL